MIDWGAPRIAGPFALEKIDRLGGNGQCPRLSNVSRARHRGQAPPTLQLRRQLPGLESRLEPMSLLRRRCGFDRRLGSRECSRVTRLLFPLHPPVAPRRHNKLNGFETRQPLLASTVGPIGIPIGPYPYRGRGDPYRGTST
eukprot:COSAG05_NODE_62_length_23051_cov_19.660291_8_plen_141_part_00